MVTVTILMPVYNGERFIGDTLASLRCQAFTDFEIFCIDDCSSDASIEIIRRHATKDPRVRLFRSETNQGSVPPVLNSILGHVTSEYVAYTSQDDLFSADWLSSMVERAMETNADAVLPDVQFMMHENSPPSAIIGLKGNRDVILSNREAVTASLDWTIHGWALWRSTIVKKHRYAEFSSSGDEFSTRQFFLACSRIAFSGGVFYSRQNNPDAITKKRTFRVFELARTNLGVLDLIEGSGFPDDDCSTQFLRSMNLLIGLCREAIAKPEIYPAQDFERSRASLNDAFRQLGPARALQKLVKYHAKYKFKTKIKLMLFVLLCQPMRLLTLSRLGRRV